MKIQIKDMLYQRFEYLLDCELKWQCNRGLYSWWSEVEWADNMIHMALADILAKELAARMP